MLYDVLCDERFHDEIFFTSFQCHHEYVDWIALTYLVIRDSFRPYVQAGGRAGGIVIYSFGFILLGLDIDVREIGRTTCNNNTINNSNNNHQSRIKPHYLRIAEIAGASALMTLIASFAG